jgi:hypothetical protein
MSEFGSNSYCVVETIHQLHKHKLPYFIKGWDLTSFLSPGSLT